MSGGLAAGIAGRQVAATVLTAPLVGGVRCAAAALGGGGRHRPPASSQPAASGGRCDGRCGGGGWRCRRRGCRGRNRVDGAVAITGGSADLHAVRPQDRGIGGGRRGGGVGRVHRPHVAALLRRPQRALWVPDGTAYGQGLSSWAGVCATADDGGGKGGGKGVRRIVAAAPSVKVPHVAGCAVQRDGAGALKTADGACVGFGRGVTRHGRGKEEETRGGGLCSSLRFVRSVV